MKITIKQFETDQESIVIEDVVSFNVVKDYHRKKLQVTVYTVYEARAIYPVSSIHIEENPGANQS